MAASTPRVVFMGSPAFAVPTLSMLAERPDLCEIVTVVCQPDKPAGRGRKITECAVKTAARARGIPVFQPAKMKVAETRDHLSGLTPDLFVVAAYGRILPPSLLAIPKVDCVNVHASLLPRQRGAAPIAHAILEGDREVGVSIMRMEEGMDTGPVFATRSRPARPDDTRGGLTVELSQMGAALLVDVFASIAEGSLRPTAQDDALATYAPMLSKADGWLDFRQPAATLQRRTRGLFPWPGTYAVRGDARVQVMRAAVAAWEQPDAPGTVVRADASGVWIACGGEGGAALRLDEVKPAGRKQMAAAAWVAGRGIEAGVRFDPPP